MNRTKPFNLTYDATTGIFMVAALQEKATAERAEASRLEQDAIKARPSVAGDIDMMKSTQALNRAKLLEAAANEIHAAVHTALVADFNAAFERMGE